MQELPIESSFRITRWAHDGLGGVLPSPGGLTQLEAHPSQEAILLGN